MIKLKTENIVRKATALRDILRIMEVSPAYLISHIFFSFAIAFFDGLSVGLLVPLAKGIIDANFNFLERAPLFKTVIVHFPHLLTKAPAKFLFLLLVLTIFIAAVIKNVLSYLVALYDSHQRGKYLFNLKRFIFNRYLSFGKLFYDRTSMGHLHRVLSFCENVAERISIFIERTPTIFFTIIFYFAIMFFISWKLTIFAVIILPVIHLSLKWVIAKLEKTAYYQTQTYLKFSHEVFNILSCIPLVKAYSKEEEAKEKFGRLNDLIRRLNFSMAKKEKIIQPFQEIITLVALLLLISTAAFIFIKEKLVGISGFLIFFYILRRSLPFFIAFNEYRAYVVGVKPYVRAILKMATDEGKYFVPEGNRVFTSLKEKIEFNHLSFYYIKEVPILKDLSFTIEKGKMTAIVGPTGAGKTTIISLLMRFYNCPPSSIFIDGIDIREFTSKSLLKHTALVSQDILLFNDTLRYNISFGIDGEVSEEKLIDIAKKARLYDFIMKLPLRFDTEVGDRGIKLSGGEKQRVSIARALLRKAEILILDEATSSLDTRTERLIQEAINEAVKGRTTIVIAHRLSTVQHADKIVIIESGSLIEQGTLNELLAKKGKFYQYWEEQKFY